MLDFEALHEVQQRNFSALLTANRTAVAGYQDFCARLVERCAAQAAETRDPRQARGDAGRLSTAFPAPY